MTTSSPSLAHKLSGHANEKAIKTLDAPVSGGDVGARNATLSIMVGGPKETFDTVLPIFQAMGKNIRYMGPTGTSPSLLQRLEFKGKGLQSLSKCS